MNHSHKQTSQTITLITVNGKTRYQPVLANGQRRYHHPRGKPVAFFDPKGVWLKPSNEQRPVSFRTKWQAQLVAQVQEQLYVLNLRALYSHIRPQQ